MRIPFAIIVVLLFYCVGCEKTTDPAPDNTFAIYLLRDSTLNSYDVWDQPIENLVPAEMPLFTDNDLIAYEWHTHTLLATASLDTQLSIYQFKYGNTSGIPFIVMVGQESIYIGSFWWMHSSMLPVKLARIIFPSKQEYFIRPPYDSTLDRRNNIRIYTALKARGKLK
jgi:hypothetical protein